MVIIIAPKIDWGFTLCQVLLWVAPRGLLSPPCPERGHMIFSSYKRGREEGTQGSGQCYKSTVPNLFGTRDWFHGRQFFHGGGGVGGEGTGGNARDGERWAAADEALLAHPPLTSCCAAQFLTGCGPVLVQGPGDGDPCYKWLRPFVCHSLEVGCLPLWTQVGICQW